MLLNPYIEEEWTTFKLEHLPPKSYSYKWNYRNFFDDYHDLTSIIYEHNFHKNKNFEQVAKNNENLLDLFNEKKSFLSSSKIMVSNLKNKMIDIYKSYRNVLFENEIKKVYNILCIDQQTLEKSDKAPFCLSNLLMENLEKLSCYTNENEIIVNDQKYIRNPHRDSFLEFLRVN